MVITVQVGVAMTATLRGRHGRQHWHMHRYDDTPGHQRPATPQSTNLAVYMRAGGLQQCPSLPNSLSICIFTRYRRWLYREKKHLL